MVTLGPRERSKGGKSGHRRTGCPLIGGGSHLRIMESAAESKPPRYLRGKGERVVKETTRS